MSSNNHLHLIFFFILICIHQSSSQPSPNHKNIQLIGHTRYVSLREEAQRNFCGNFWCTNDAFYLFTKSSQYVGVDPCDDFKNFTVNHVEEVDHPDDRLRYRGFHSIVYNINIERLRKVVAAKIDPIKDTRIIKVMKNTFQKCLKSPVLTRHLQAHKDIITHLQSLGGSPYLSKHTSFNLNLFNDDAVEYFYSVYNHHYTLNLNFNISDALWNENDFKFKKLFENEPYHALNLFFNLEVKRCEGEILCFTQPDQRWKYHENKKFILEVFKELFNELEDSYRHPKVYKKLIIDEILTPTVSREQEYLKKRDEIVNKFNTNGSAKISIKDLKEKLSSNIDIDWLKIINNQLLNHSKVTENEEILIENGGIEMLQELVRNLVKTDKKILADAFVSTFLYSNRFVLILRFHNQQSFVQYGTKKGSQRWHLCMFQYHHLYMYPAHIFMYEQFRPIWDRTVGDFNRDLIDERVDIIEGAKKLILEAVNEFNLRFKRGTSLKPSIAIEILNKLNSLKVIVSLQSNVFTAKILEEFYNELQLKGDEEFLPSVWEMQRNHRKILNEPRGSWRKQIDRMVYAQGEDWITYNIEDGNILFIPAKHVIYPHYHPLRPRFFNMATIFKEVIGRLHVGVTNYVKNKFNLKPLEFTTGIDGNVQTAYEHYSHWLQNHNDLIIGANLLTHRQLYWVAHAIQSYIRYHKNIETPRKLDQKYFHVFYKKSKGFQEAFQCNITADEFKEYEEYKRKLKEI